MPADHVVVAWNQKPPFTGLAAHPAQRRDALDKAGLVIGIEGCDDHPVVAMSLFEFLSVPNMRLTVLQWYILFPSVTLITRS